MEHVVFFPAPDGTPAFRRLASLDEAVRLVEHLRNVEGVTQAGVHALTEVPLSFRAYYRVEVPVAPDVAQEPPTPSLEAAPVVVPLVVVPAQPVVAAEPVAVPYAGPEPAPELALVDALPVEVPEAGEPAQDYVPEPAMASAHGRSGPASLGFFA